MMRSDEGREVRPAMKRDREGEEHKDPEIGHEEVEASHAMGSHESVNAAEAEDFPDTASAKANRKEADEPEREESEQRAIGRERTIPARNVMGHGMREPKARNTI